MNLMTEMLNGKIFTEDDLDCKIFVMTWKNKTNGKTYYQTVFGDPRFWIPYHIAESCGSADDIKKLSTNIIHSPGYHGFFKLIGEKHPEWFNSTSVDSYERFKTETNKRIDINTVPIFDLDDPDIVKKVCG